MMIIKNIFIQAKNSSLTRDSFWSVFGNAMSMLILMICGIIIARILGKDEYGQYGTVKNLMTSLASFAAFGFGYSSTKLVSSDSIKYGGLSISVPNIVTIISVFISFLLFSFSSQISLFLKKQELKTFIVFICFLMLLKALQTVGNGVLAGYKQFKRIGENAIISSFLMLLLCYPFTKLWGLLGALIALIIYQGFSAFLALFFSYKIDKPRQTYYLSNYIEIIKKTLPVSLHEISYTVSSIILILVILHYSSYGDYALYSIASQWNAVILVVPMLLMNLTLSYLSSEKTLSTHRRMLKIMLMINLISTLLVLLFVYLGSSMIVKLYGNDFSDLARILKVSVFTTLFSSVSLVYQSNFISYGRSWRLALYRLGKDVIGIMVLILYFKNSLPQNCAYIAVIVDLFMNIIYMSLLVLDDLFYSYSQETVRR